ncbi:hypothetical protein [Rhodococcus sp. NPDC057529]|uniref:ABC transporter ATP-binding protein n=1 Tax=Rhodococcus sp. NPDC057529 TaxID=3346158 RepID=UPI003672F8B3
MACTGHWQSCRVVILDEAVSAFDVSVQAQIFTLLDGTVAVLRRVARRQPRSRRGRPEVTQRVLVLYKGAIVEEGAATEVLQAPQHPYTRLLVSSTPGEGCDPAAVVEQCHQFNTAQASGEHFDTGVESTIRA